MKLAEMIGNAAEKSFTEQELNNLRIAKNAKAVFEVLDNNFFGVNGGGYGGKAYDIMKSVEELCDGFVVDIAKRFALATFKMSSKQAWVIAFNFIKIEKEIKFDEIYKSE